MIKLPHLETNVTIACQLRCASCNHFVALQADKFKSSMIEPETLERDLRHFSRVAHVEGYAMIGGEPTLHPKLVELLEIARASGVADRLEVWTNGIGLVKRYPESHPFWKSLDQLVLSRYAGKLTDEEVGAMQSRCTASGVNFRLNDERNSPNWTLLLEPAPTDDAYTQRKYEACWFKTYSRVLDNGHFSRCCTIPFIPSLIQGRQFGDDMLEVDASLTEEKLNSFLNQKQFPQACRSCRGRSTESSRALVSWREERDPEQWIRKSQGLA